MEHPCHIVQYLCPATLNLALPTLQAIGWGITLQLIVVAFLAHCLRPCFDQTVLMQRRYWSNYVDLEQKLFDKTCCEHARGFAHRCVLHFFASMQSEMRARGLPRDSAGRGPETPEMLSPARAWTVEAGEPTRAQSPVRSRWTTA